MTEIYSESLQKSRRRLLRASTTRAEAKLWRIIRNNQIGYKVKRQFGVGPYIVDFFIAEVQLVIEVDGDSHFLPGADVQDQNREKDLRALGLEIIRFTDREIFESIECVIDLICERAKTLALRRRG